MRIEELLLGRGLVTEEALERARRESRATRSALRDVLYRDGLVTEEQVGWHLADANGLPFVHVTPEIVDARLAQRGGAALLRGRCALPLQPVGDEVTVVVSDPETAGPVEDFRLAFGDGHRVSLAVAQESRIRSIQDRLFGCPSECPSTSWEGLDDPSGVATLYGHLVRAVRSGADELRFDPTPQGLAVRTRAGGEVQTVDRLPERCAYAVGARARMLVDGAYSGRVQTVIGGSDLELTIDVVPTRLAEAVVIGIRGASRAALPAALTADRVLGEEAAARAVHLLLSGPVLLVAGPDARSRENLAHGLLRLAGALAQPVVVVEGWEPTNDLDAVPLAPGQIDRVTALRGRVVLADAATLAPADVRLLAASVPSIVLVARECGAAAALALCREELRPLVRAAVCPSGVVESPAWS